MKMIECGKIAGIVEVLYAILDYKGMYLLANLKRFVLKSK